MATKKKTNEETVKYQPVFGLMLDDVIRQHRWRMESDIKIKANYGNIYLVTYSFVVPYYNEKAELCKLDFQLMINTLEVKGQEDKTDINLFCTEYVGEHSTTNRIYKHGSKVEVVHERVSKKIWDHVTPTNMAFAEFTAWRDETKEHNETFVGNYYD